MINWNGRRYVPAGLKPFLNRKGVPVNGRPKTAWVASFVGGETEEAPSPTPITPTPSITPTLTPTQTLPETCHIEAQNGDILIAQNGDYIDHFPCIEPSPTPSITPTSTITPTPSFTPTITPTITPTPSSIPLDPDAAAYLADVVASGGTTNPTIEAAVQTLFTDLKSAGLYSKMIAMYPFVGATSGSHAINATLDKTYDITWNGGMTHTISGSTGDGINGYGDTNFTEGDFTDINKGSFGSYMTISGNDGVDGCLSGLGRLQIRYNVSNEIRYGYGDGSSQIYNHGGSILNGNYAQIRTGNTENKLYHNGINIDTQTTPNTTTDSLNYYIFRFNAGTPYWGTYTLGFYFFINDITYSELPTLQGIINTFQTSLGRNTY